MATTFILGDSTSMTIGLEQKSYPYLIAERSIWPDNTRIINSSQPGITAADAASFFSLFQSKYKDLNTVIIYLGNCDANANELHKGRMTDARLMWQRASTFLGLRSRKTVLRNKLMRFEWNDSYNPALEQAEYIEDFEYNLMCIIRGCRKRKIKVVLVRPRANFSFPAGVGKGNFIYYHFLPFMPQFGRVLAHPDNRFIEAFSEYENGNFEQSRIKYKAILDTPVPGVTCSEYPLIVVHNYALASALAGKVDEALVLLDLILKESTVRREIVLFNKAYLLRLKGDKSLSEKCFYDAYNADSSMYRVKQAHLDAIDRVSQAAVGDVKVVDMAEFKDDDYVDHCHLKDTAQILLADKIEDALRELGVSSGKSCATIESRLLNLELALGNNTPFFDYYRVYSDLTSEQIEKDVELLRRDLDGGEVVSDRALCLISAPVAKTIDYAKRHPCFTDIRDFLNLPPQSPLDVGRFPEYFIMRRLAPYLDAALSDVPKVKVMGGLLHSGDQLLKIVPPFEKSFEVKNVVIDELSDAWVYRIIKNVYFVLKQHLEAGPQVYERLETTIFWYFREVLRWGSHSRISMRYDRMTLEFIAEALAVAAWIDFKMNLGMTEDIFKLAGFLVNVTAVHEKYCVQFKPDEDNSDLMKRYRMELNTRLSELRSFNVGDNVAIIGEK